MSKTGWRSLSIPAEMYEHIQTLIEKPEVKKKYGFDSVAEFIRAALRKLIHEVEG